MLKSYFKKTQTIKKTQNQTGKPQPVSGKAVQSVLIEWKRIFFK